MQGSGVSSSSCLMMAKSPWYHLQSQADQAVLLFDPGGGSSYLVIADPPVIMASSHRKASACIVHALRSNRPAGLRLNDPVSQLLLQATVLPQTQRYGDGGLLALHIACT
jgi:hypothetical protein